MVPLIERFERQIVVAGGRLVGFEVGKEELRVFASQVHNPEDVFEFLMTWDDEGVDLGEGLDGEEEEVEDSGGVEVVISDDEDEDDEDEDDMGDFIVEV
jgi:hypothetical protein